MVIVPPYGSPGMSGRSFIESHEHRHLRNRSPPASPHGIWPEVIARTVSRLRSSVPSRDRYRTSGHRGAAAARPMLRTVNETSNVSPQYAEVFTGVSVTTVRSGRETLIGVMKASPTSPFGSAPFWFIRLPEASAMSGPTVSVYGPSTVGGVKRTRNWVPAVPRGSIAVIAVAPLGPTRLTSVKVNVTGEMRLSNAMST